jgi:branched-chain amino acid transport system substrate-binding protein
MIPPVDAHFCVEVDARAAVVSVEVGALADVPEELREIARGLIADRVSHCAFIWAPDPGPAAAKVVPCWVSVSLSAQDPSPTAVVTGSWCYELPYGLTLRELDVLTLLAVGLPNADIASRLSLSTRTVTTHVDHIMRKIGVFSRTSAAVVAVDEGIIRVPFPGGEEDFDLLRLGRSLHGRANARRAPGPRVMRRPLVIGAALPLRGFVAGDGLEMVHASQLAVDELNERGGVDGRMVAMEIVDVDIMDASSVRQALEKLAAREVDVITSGYFAHQEIAHEIVADAGIPYLHAATMDAMEQRVLGDPGRYGRIFQVCPSDSNYAPRFVEVMTSLRDRGQWRPSSRRLVIIQSAWDQTNLGIAAAADLAERGGWDLEVVRLIAESRESWSQVAERIRASEPGAVMIGHYLVEGTVSFLDTFLSDPSDTLVYALYSPSVPEFRELMGPRADGLLWATVTGTYSDPLARAFVGKYRDRFGKNPGRSHAGISYDRVRVIAQAWKHAVNPRDPGAVAEELRQIVHRGVNGVYYFGGQSQTALTYPSTSVDPSLAQAHLVFQIQDGKQRIIDPSPYADGSFVAPSWIPVSRLSSGVVGS